MANSRLAQPIRFLILFSRELSDCFRNSSSITELLVCITSSDNVRLFAGCCYFAIGSGLMTNVVVMNWKSPSPQQLPPGPPLGKLEPADPVAEEFMGSYPDYRYERLSELGSRMKKSWGIMIKKSDSTEHKDEALLLTVAPVSQNCPLLLHEHQKGLNKLLGAIRESQHPFIHPVKEVHYNTYHEKLVIVQPYRKEGSLKDLIYKVGSPTLDWSQKYARRSKGLSPEKVARYGRHILEAMQFLYSIGLPPIDHIQSGNIVVVNNVCLLGGYENTLLGYKTRLYRLCKDHLSHLDVILFGHLIFEMAAGYELTELRPGAGEYKEVPSAVRPILDYIFTDGFPHSIEDITKHEFFKLEDGDSPEPKKPDPSNVRGQLTDSARTVLDKVRKNKPRVQKPPAAEGGFKAPFSRVLRFLKVKKDDKNADQVSISSKQSQT